ncbi:MAG: DUF4173 domain-containing protein [Chlorobi bacterium]|nr:DUF4173 domain-containing protein [Chlorobiota bacterium]MCI0714826.1 DUF4173 domain-containing protein [Chlorobiota bacterium]
MNRQNITYLFLLILLAIYNFFFWREKLGINLLIFLFLSSFAVLILNEENLKSRNVIVSLLAFLYASAMVLVINSDFSKFASMTVFAVFVGFAHQKELKTVFNAFFTTASSVIIFPYNIIEELKQSSGKYKPVRVILRFTKLALIPVIFFTVFYSIYAYSNPVFNSYSVTFWDTIGEYVYEVFKDYPPLRFMFLFLGLILIMGMLYNRNIKIFAVIDKNFLDTLSRDKIFKTYGVLNPSVKKNLLYDLFGYKHKMNTLKFEYKMGVTFIVMINLLLLILNIIDFQFTWLGFDSKMVDNLAFYVHNGTYLLIFSILLSMAILLYFFRGNQNFYNGRMLLKLDAYLWIIQNAFMALSVGLRNLYYIDYYYALSYKRIGVMVYLLLTLIGLTTMFIKIYSKRTVYHLLKVNSTAALIVLLLISSFSWDKLIAEFNLSYPDKDSIDVEYLLRLSDDTLPVLDKHQNVLDKQYYNKGFFFGDHENGLKMYHRKVESYLYQQKNYSWLSWNLADYNTLKYYNYEEERK